MSDVKDELAVTRTPEAFRKRARDRLLPAPADTRAAQSTPSDFDLNPGADAPRPTALRPAAVLIPIVCRSQLTVLLTERTGHLPAHAGQIAFPGGKIEETDADALSAALRETEEEIGLSRNDVEPLGFVDPYRTGTGFIITPVVALVSPTFTANPDSREVADVFEVPLDFLMEPANHRIDTLFWKGADRRFYAMPYEQRYIWGATAGIIRTLYRRMFVT